MSPDFSSSWEVSCTLYKEQFPDSPQRGSGLSDNGDVVKWCTRGDGNGLLLCLTLSLWQGRAASSPSAHVWPGSTSNCPATPATCLGYQMTSAMVMAGPCFVHGADWASRCLLVSCVPSLHPSILPTPPWCISPGRRTAACDRPPLIQQTPVSSWNSDGPCSRDSFTLGLRAEREWEGAREREPSHNLAQRKHSTLALTHKKMMKEVTFNWRRFQFLWCFFSRPSSWMNSSVLLLAL